MILRDGLASVGAVFETVLEDVVVLISVFVTIDSLKIVRHMPDVGYEHLPR